MTKMPPQLEKDDPLPTKIPRVDQVDPNSSDHVVATTQLKEKIASLQKQLSAKDAQLLAKDRQVHFTCRQMKIIGLNRDR